MSVATPPGQMGKQTMSDDKQQLATPAEVLTEVLVLKMKLPNHEVDGGLTHTIRRGPDGHLRTSEDRACARADDDELGRLDALAEKCLHALEEDEGANGVHFKMLAQLLRWSL